MKATISSWLPEAAKLFGIKEEELLAKSVANFIENEIFNCQKKIGELLLADVGFQKKYKMTIQELRQELERRENSDHYEDEKIDSIPLLETISDTRSWGHVKENLQRETERLFKLKEIQIGVK